MNNRVWLVRAPNGEIIGAAADRTLARGEWLYADGAYRALDDAQSVTLCDPAILAIRRRVTTSPTRERYDADGYTLALETMMPREAREGEGS